jgi:hypothetical protein
VGPFCAPITNVGQQDAFVLQDKVIEAILAAEREVEARAAAPTAVDPIQQTVTETIKDGIRRRAVDREKAKTCITFLGQPMGKALHARLRSVYEGWEAKKDDKELVEAVFALSEQFGKEKTDQVPVNRLAREDLELICYEYLSFRIGSFRDSTQRPRERWGRSPTASASRFVAVHQRSMYVTTSRLGSTLSRIARYLTSRSRSRLAPSTCFSKTAMCRSRYSSNPPTARCSSIHRQFSSCSASSGYRSGEAPFVSSTD